MPAFLVAVPDSYTGHRANGVTSAIVFAKDATDAKAIAKGGSAGDPNSMWNAATVTEIAAPADLQGFTFQIDVTNKTTNQITHSVSVTGPAAATIDSIAALLVTALNATSINGAAYNSTSQVLTISDVTDALGARKVDVRVIPPGLTEAVSIDGMFSTIVDEGIAAAVLSVTLGADAYVLPKLYALK